MSCLRRFLSVATIAVTAATVLCAPATSAGAAASDGAPGGVKGYGVAVVVGPFVSYWCVAIAPTAAASTSIDSCRLYVDGAFVAEAPDVSLPGQIAITGATGAARPGAQVAVCWDVSAESTLGGRVTTSGCSAAVPSAAAGTGSGSGVEGSGGMTMIGQLNPQSALIAFWCGAVATVPATSVTIESCRLYANGVFVADAEPIALSGEAAATGALAVVWPFAALTVCWEVSADTFFDGQPTDAGCTGGTRLAPV